MAINFNPNLPPNDSLTPSEIEKWVQAELHKIQDSTKKAYCIAGVPVNVAIRAAEALTTSRDVLNKTQLKKHRRDINDARIWHRAKQYVRGDETHA